MIILINSYKPPVIIIHSQPEQQEKDQEHWRPAPRLDYRVECPPAVKLLWTSCSAPVPYPYQADCTATKGTGTCYWQIKHQLQL